MSSGLLLLLVGPGSFLIMFAVLGSYDLAERRAKRRADR